MAKKEEKTKQKSRYFKDMKAELKKVIWPTRKELLNNTLSVIAFTLIIAVIVFVLDLCFDSINKYGVTPLQEKVQSSYKAAHNSETTDENKESSEEGEESKSEGEEEGTKTENENNEEETKTENGDNEEETKTEDEGNKEESKTENKSKEESKTDNEKSNNN